MPPTTPIAGSGILWPEMAYSQKRLREIYDKTTGYCHICHKKLSFKNYGTVGARAAWEVEHSKPRTKGGTDHLNNLYPACISCNRSKGKNTNWTARAKHGVKIAPLSPKRRKRAKKQNALAGGLAGVGIGSILGLAGAAAGGIIGAIFEYDKNPDKDD